MSDVALPRRSYDHRIREAIWETRDPDLFPELRIPASTLRCWLHRGAVDVKTVDVFEDDRLKLLTENRELQRRVAFLGGEMPPILPTRSKRSLAITSDLRFRKLQVMWLWSRISR